MKRALAVASIFATLYLSMVPVLAQNCSTCKPTRHNITTNLMAVEICFDTDDFDADQRGWMQTGIQEYWANTLNSMGVPIEFTFTSSASCDTNKAEVVRSSAGDVPSNGAAATITPDAHGEAKVRVHTDFTGTEDQWKALGAHEIGHILDFDHAPGDCNAYSIMTPEGFTWGSVKCGDSGGISDRWYFDEGDSSEPSETQEDCWDIYLVRTTYCHGPNGWYQCAVYYFYLYTECIPLL